MNRTSRLSALVIAAVAALGLAVQFRASTELTGSAGAAAWTMLRYFTIITNAAVMVLMAAIAAGLVQLRSAFLIGGATIAILLVAIVHFLLLRGLLELSGGAYFADFLLHQAVPALTFLFWLALVPKGGLRWFDPLKWTIYPLAYLAYAFVRGGIDGKYPYPFLDVSQVGLANALANCAVIAAGFITGGLLLVALDRWLGARGANR